MTLEQLLMQFGFFISMAQCRKMAWEGHITIDGRQITGNDLGYKAEEYAKVGSTIKIGRATKTVEDRHMR